MQYEFRWNAWNADHIAKHGLSTVDVEHIVRRARPPYPQERGDDKWFVVGQCQDGAYVQVIYIFDPVDVIFVIHARPLTDVEKRRYRRRTR